MAGQDAQTFEERADQIDDHALLNETVAEDHFDTVHRALVSKGLVLIEGPRGSGKTHLMRFTAVRCRQENKLPLALYVSFNRYLRLEPLLRKKSDALVTFQAWILANILIEASAVDEQLRHPSSDSFLEEVFGFTADSLQRLVDSLERQLMPDEEEEDLIRFLSIDKVKDFLLALCDRHKRKRVVVLLDDAALTLTPEYLVELFDVVRVLKHSRIAPKASVYPGSTEYGPRFHADHEGRTVSAWLPVDTENYEQTMREIASKRFSSVQLPRADINELFMFASFGIPRAYLNMLRAYRDASGSEQQRVNTIIQEHHKLRLQEFRSIAQKVPKLGILVKTGEHFFSRCIEAIRQANHGMDRDEKQLVLGIETSGLTPMINRMINLLIEAGLLYEYKSEVSHGGADRTYRRFTPHISSLIASRSLGSPSRGSSSKHSLEVLKLRQTKHPVRRKIDTILDDSEIHEIRFDLPACDNCQTRRLSDSQLFCHACGERLVTASTYETCMKTPISHVPGLTGWQIESLATEAINVVGDFVAIQDSGTKLRQIWQFGPKRSVAVAEKIHTYVDEFMS
ncbi:hypothetical protein [Agrobacterium larrymoorei]|uniref:ORC-CDC6 family AAA ATPase n=1 Tax=Agrobacterium larrymoorei TaxID=160699 RepID=UPI0030C52354